MLRPKRAKLVGVVWCLGGQGGVDPGSNEEISSDLRDLNLIMSLGWEGFDPQKHVHQKAMRSESIPRCSMYIQYMATLTPEIIPMYVNVQYMELLGLCFFRCFSVQGWIYTAGFSQC